MKKKKIVDRELTKEEDNKRRKYTEERIAFYKMALKYTKHSKRKHQVREKLRYHKWIHGIWD